MLNPETFESFIDEIRGFRKYHPELSGEAFAIGYMSGMLDMTDDQYRAMMKVIYKKD